MTRQEQRPVDGGDRADRVVVGADGSAASANALRWAMADVARSGGTVEVVHVVPDYAPVAYPIPLDDLVRAGRATLDATVEQAGAARRRAPGGAVAVVTRLERGGAVRTLVSAGERSRAVVLGSDRRSVSMRLLTGNVSTGVAARADVPVVCVPETWQAGAPAGALLAAVKHPEHAGPLMAEAFDVARRTGSRLVVLHAWRLPSAYDGIVVADADALARWNARAQRQLEELVTPWRRSHPDVEVELRTVDDHPAPALVAASEYADELLLLRRAHGFPPAAHLGSTARTVLLHAHCPVRVVPADQHAQHPQDLADLALEADGRALKQATTA